MRILSYSSLLILTMTTLAGCQITPFTSAPNPDYRIRVIPSADGRNYTIEKPNCPNWSDVQNSVDVNQRMPQLGCATARNLAAQIDRPMDLVKPRKLGAPDATISAGSISAYRSGKTKALINPNAEAPTVDMTTGTGSAQTK